MSSDLSVAIGLTLLAWIHRILFLVSNRDRSWPLTIFYEGDAQTFFLHARALIANEIYDGGLPFHPPGFPVLLSFVHRVVGAGEGVSEIPHLAVKISLALLASCSVGLFYMLVKPYLGKAVATVTCLMMVYHFGLMVLAVAPVSEGLYLTLLVAALLIWSRLLTKPVGTGNAVHPRVAALSLGVVLGAIALTRAEGLLMAGLMVVAGLGLQAAVDRRRSALAPWFISGIVCLLVISPWTIRNWRQMNEVNRRLQSTLAEPLPTFVPVTLYGPLNLSLANRVGADGTFSPEFLDQGNGRLDLADPEVLRVLLHGDEMAWGWIRNNPGDFLRLTFRRWSLTTDAFKHGFTQWNWPGGLRGTRRPVDIFIPDVSLTDWLLPIVILIGLFLCLRQADGRRWLIVVAIPTSVWLLTTGLFYGYARLALIVFPFWLSLAAVVLTALFSGLPNRYRRFGTGAILLLIVILMGIEGRGATTDRNYRATASTVDGHHLNRDASMVIEVIEPQDDR